MEKGCAGEARSLNRARLDAIRREIPGYRAWLDPAESNSLTARGRRRAARWQVDPGCQRDKERGGCGLAGPRGRKGNWAETRGRENGPRLQREKKGSWACWFPGVSPLLFFPFFSNSFSQEFLSKTIKIKQHKNNYAPAWMQNHISNLMMIFILHKIIYLLYPMPKKNT